MGEQPTVYNLKEIKLEVTHVCHLRCSHCSSLATPDNQRELSWQDCERIIDEASVMGVREIAFSGGEPLLWPHLQKAIECAESYGMKTCLYSSGTVSDCNVFNQLKSAGLRRIIFSLFGADLTAHESVTGIIGSYGKTLAAVSACNQIDLETELHFVPLPHNYTALMDLAELAKSNNISRISVLRLVPQGRAKGTDQTLLTREQNLHLRGIIADLRKQGYDIRTGSPYNFLMLKDKPQCNSGVDRLTIGPDLRIFPCDAFKQLPPFVLGITDLYSNLSDNTLADCWEKSPYLNSVREYLISDFASECASCISLEKCHSGCVAQKIHASGSMSKLPDPMCLLGKGVASL